jgi:Class III cytochrome C family
MHKKQIIMICLAISIFLAAGLVIASDDEGETLCIPLGVITLAPPDSVEAKRSEVEFPHSDHFGISCQQCHHQWDGESEIESCTTSGCHDLEEAPSKEDGDEAILYYKKAFHEACIGCHKEMSAENAKLAKMYQPSDAKAVATGPTGCVKCHPKESH